MSSLTVRESPVVQPQATPAATRPPAAAVTDAGEPSPFARVLHGLGKAVQQGESLVKEASLGGAGDGTLDAGQLIALQVGVYRYSEAIDLASRLVDHATTGLKTVLQGQ
jgi:hypothetical protein